jgi:hypothetical protein
MKEATGELNMTVVTLIAIAAIGAIFYFVVWPLIQRQVVNQSCRTTYGPNWVAARGENDDISGGNTQATVHEWWCCPSEAAAATPMEPDCHPAND